MDWDTALGVCASVIVSFGGAGAIIRGVAKFLVNRIADRLQEKYELKLSKELESFKTILGNKSYVSKTRFDTEFQIYRQLSEITVTMVKEVSQLFPTFTRDTRNDYEAYKEKYDIALEKVVSFQDALAANAPFIPGEIYLIFRDLETKCKTQLDDFIDFRLKSDAKKNIADCGAAYREVWARTRELQTDLDTIIQKLREYLANLEVIE